MSGSMTPGDRRRARAKAAEDARSETRRTRPRSEVPYPRLVISASDLTVGEDPETGDLFTGPGIDLTVEFSEQIGRALIPADRYELDLANTPENWDTLIAIAQRWATGRGFDPLGPINRTDPGTAEYQYLALRRTP